MVESWADEVHGAEFGDLRLSKRLSKIVEHLGSLPNASIPAAIDGRSEMEAAYRFFDNGKVTPEAIVEPHRQATLHRARQHTVLLLVQDTTEVNLTRPNQQVLGAGPLEHESRRGVFYHPLMAFSAEGLALGTVWSKTWARKTIHSKRTAAEKARHQRRTPIEGKESMRWLEGVREARSVAQACPQTECVCIADSEADIYELFAEPRSSGTGKELQLLVRAYHDRVLIGSEEKLLATVRRSECLYECSVDVSSRKQKTNAKTNPRRATRDARIAKVEIRATSVTLVPPPRFDRKLHEIHINAVLVEETNPPQGQQPIQWLLLTTLPVNEPDQVRRVVQYYCVRWQIEIYFRTLKSGCRIEDRYFERVGRLLNCLAVYTIVAWKILYLCRLGRDCPDIDCEVVFSTSEWRAVYMTVRHQPPPEDPPTLNEVIRMVASLGGYVIRAKTNPGTQTLWFGLQRLHDLSTAWDTFGPNSHPPWKKISDNTCVVR
jgi:hypothetical protein